MFKVGIPYVFSRRKFIKSLGKEGYKEIAGLYSWLNDVRGVVFIPVNSSYHYIDGYSVNSTWCTELPIRPKRIVKKVKLGYGTCKQIPKMGCKIAASKPKLSLDELAGSDTLCEHCHCTEYGLYMDASGVTGTPNGYSSCEGMYCGDAYAAYLDSEEEAND